jgi:hypothetical protein
MRFIEPDHGYGKGMAAGAMIGYLQLIPLNDALSAVNAAARSSGVSPLELRSRSGNDQAELDHRFDRSFEVTPFHLAHVWERLM